MTQLRKMMLEELQRRNYSQTTVKGYLKIVEAFAKHFHCSPAQLGPEEIRALHSLLSPLRRAARSRQACQCLPADWTNEPSQTALWRILKRLVFC